MSQNKTVIQGLEPETNFGGSQSGSNSTNFYSRGNQSASARGTIVPGMQDAGLGNENIQERASAPQKNYARVVQSGKPIVGFLYSVSRTPLGEFWPIQMGKNTIGQSSDNDIVLLEGTISSKHAVIVTRQGKNGIIAAIKDTESTNGTFINGEPIDFSAEECHDGDKITIGNNYQFLFILIDSAKLGLTTSTNFIAVEDPDSINTDDIDIPPFNPGTTRPGGFDPYNDGPSTWGTTGGGYSPTGGTVGMDGSVSGGNHGGTIPM